MTHPVLNDLRLPVVAAPMFLISGPELVIAASKAGVLGSFPAPNCRTTEELDRWLGTVTDGLTEDGVTKPWALNMVTHSSNPRLAEDLKVVAEHKPPIVITALGSPRPVMEVVKGYGGTVIADVVSLKLAHKAAAARADGLACVSSGSGGHTGHLNPFAFVSAVRDFFDGIVAVGGGIADGHGVAGAVAAGADLVYVGTRFLATRESMAPDAYKQMVVDSGTDDLIVSDGITGTPASWLRPSLVENGLDPDNLVAPEKRAYGSGNGHTRWKDIWAAGQGIQVIQDAPAVADVVDQLVADYGVALSRLDRFRGGVLV
ncbi:nitronate monooxygenase [Nocardioides sp. JQ2195]|uniref:NAD(P)H-dependent flavin oxidoreductase n=1 Tax=Nocardioides sp. JQ2195 TaxID=2592334 RepID=UPI00143E8090|nr:nitronate monooxygenase [Nocardioides sp. JQ2195]QIX25526.1 nitronate monooxygenase [Nocardioides sp. JQ2195]